MSNIIETTIQKEIVNGYIKWLCKKLRENQESEILVEGEEVEYTCLIDEQKASFVRFVVEDQIEYFIVDGDELYTVEHSEPTQRFFDISADFATQLKVEYYTGTIVIEH